MAESLKSFTNRVEALTGLKVNRIPNGDGEDMSVGAIIATSPHGTLVYTDYSHWDDDFGVDIYAKAVLVDRSPRLPAADPDADGDLLPA